MNIRILGAHNIESKTTRCISLLIDNTVAIDAGGLTSGLSISAQQQLKALLLTHQHYDHIRNIPDLALNHSLNGNRVQVYATPDVRSAIETHLLNGKLYPKFQEMPATRPAIDFKLIEPYVPQVIERYEILAIPVNHPGITVGYQIRDNKGSAMFYTADTGPGLSDCWRRLSPQVLIVDVTVSNRHDEFARETGHLTPDLLYEELVEFRELKRYLPRIIAVHMNPSLEKEIKEEVAVAARDLNTPITLAHEGMRVNI